MKKIKKIYCDFDGTITKEDMVNSFFEKYADEKWIESEKLWIEGKITSKENAIKQVSLIMKVTQKELDDFINQTEIDETFYDFYKFLNSKNIDLVIVSDGFDLFVKKIMERLGIYNIKYYANHLIYKDNLFSIEFPYYNPGCKKGSGMCKCSKIDEKNYLYIGDGTSDLCPAHNAEMLFAKKVLRDFCDKNSIDYTPFETFSDIQNILSSIL